MGREAAGASRSCAEEAPSENLGRYGPERPCDATQAFYCFVAICLPMLQFIISALLVGFFGGLFSGFFGIGGASVTIPLLRIFLGVPGHTALGTSLLLVVPTAATGA